MTTNWIEQARTMAPLLAEHAAEVALASARKRRDDPNVQYLAGELQNELLTARSLLDVQIANANEFDFAPGIERTSRSFQAKTVIAAACVRVVDKAMELGGGGAYFRKVGIERMLRDVRAAQYHPLQPKRQHSFCGRVALGLEPV